MMQTRQISWGRLAVSLVSCFGFFKRWVRCCFCQSIHDQWPVSFIIFQLRNAVTAIIRIRFAGTLPFVLGHPNRITFDANGLQLCLGQNKKAVFEVFAAARISNCNTNVD